MKPVLDTLDKQAKSVYLSVYVLTCMVCTVFIIPTLPLWLSPLNHNLFCFIAFLFWFTVSSWCLHFLLCCGKRGHLSSWITTSISRLTFSLFFFVSFFVFFAVVFSLPFCLPVMLQMCEVCICSQLTLYMHHSWRIWNECRCMAWCGGAAHTAYWNNSDQSLVLTMVWKYELSL